MRSRLVIRARFQTAKLLIALLRGRGRLYRLLGNRQFRWLLGPEGRNAAWRALGAQIADGARVGAGVWMRAPKNVTIGAGSKLGGRVVIESYGPVTIGENRIINDSDLFTTQHHLDDPRFKADIRFISIGDHMWMPRKIIVLPGVSIGNCAVIGTGSVVSSDIPEYAVAAGNPAKVIKERARVDYEYVPGDIVDASVKLAQERLRHS